MLVISCVYGTASSVSHLTNAPNVILLLVWVGLEFTVTLQRPLDQTE
jgi:hypothetical protein